MYYKKAKEKEKIEMKSSWPNWHVFVNDVNNLGGLMAVSGKSGLLLSTLTSWYNGTRIPRPISRPGIAVALGYPAKRY